MIPFIWVSCPLPCWFCWCWWANGYDGRYVCHMSCLDCLLDVELQFVIVSLSGWGVLIYGGYKFFTGGKSNKEEVLLDIYFFSLFLPYTLLLFLPFPSENWNGVFAPFIPLFNIWSSFNNFFPFYKWSAYQNVSFQILSSIIMIFSNHVSKYIGLCIFQDREILFFNMYNRQSIESLL